MIRAFVIALALTPVVLFGLVPLASIVLTADGLGALLNEWDAVLNTLLLAFGSGLVALLLGVPVGWIAARRTLPRVLEAALLLPYAVPPYVTTVAWILLANPTNGLFSSVLPLNIYTLTGMVFVLALHLSPLVVVGAREALGRIEPALEEAARVAGASAWTTFRRVTFPLAAPGILASASFVASGAAASFGVPYLLASSADSPIPLLTLRIFRAMELSPVAGRPLAATLSLGLVLLAASFPLLVMLLTPKGALSTARLARPRERNPVSGMEAAVVGSWLGIAVVLPILTIAVASVSTTFGSVGALTLDHWRLVLGEARSIEALARSAGLAAGAASLACLIGGALAVAGGRNPGRAMRIALEAARSPWAVPGSVFALGFLLIYSQEIRFILADRVTLVLAIANTPWVLGLAYALKSLAVPLDNVGAALRTVDPTLEEAARISGAGWLRTQSAIVLPLLMPGLIAGWTLVFAGSLCEVSMSVLLRGPGTEVLGTRLFELLSYGSPQEASVLAVIVVIAVLLGAPLLMGRAKWASN